MPLPTPQAAWTGSAILLALCLLAGCANSDAPDDDLAAIHAPEIAQVVPVSEALAGAHIPTLDPEPMNTAEIRRALETGSHCEFRYTSAGDVVLAWKENQGLVKLNGHLVILAKSRSAGGELILAAEQVRVTVQRDNRSTTERQEEVNVLFEVGRSLKAGYRGYYQCPE